ncbi:MAG TPA: FAD-dependent oxidoreductase, partial [Clostridiaceae bacterium]|nr:FAD-dependent oxidoreductase [Clostridiaceae bacterium]
MKKYVGILLCLMLLLGSLSVFADSAPAEASYTPGTYSAEVNAMHGPLEVEVTFSEDAILDINVLNHVETPGVGDAAVDKIPQAIVDNQSLMVDAVTGVTITSASIKMAVEDCVLQAGGDVDLLKETPLKPADEVSGENTADVVIVGGGGAGLSAAVAATKAGASVIMIEKTGFLGGNSIVAGGIYNAPDASLQDYHFEERSESLETLIQDAIAEEPVSDEHAELIETVKAEYDAYLESDKTLFDSTNWFALQTWNGGDKVAELDIVKIMAGRSLEALQWMESMGMEFKPVISHGGGSLYPRTHSAVLPNGSGYIKAFVSQLADADNYTEYMNTTAVGLVMDGDRVVGVEAVDKDGNALTFTANNGVILATGGFAGNVELRQEYCEGEKWPDLGAGVPTSNMPGVTGDGIFFARDAGAELVNMDQIQLLPYCNPTTGATYDIISSAGAIFVNKEGERFVREDGRRDVMSKAIIAQTDGLMYMVSSSQGRDAADIYALGGQTLQYYLDNNYGGYVWGDTVEELAEKLDLPADVLQATLDTYNENAANNVEDEFGRVSYSGT